MSLFPGGSLESRGSEEKWKRMRGIIQNLISIPGILLDPLFPPRLGVGKEVGRRVSKERQGRWAHV